MAALGAANKGVTTAWPLAAFIRNFIAWSERRRYQVLIRHVPGKENLWADGLSRDDPDTLAQFHTSQRLEVPLATIFFSASVDISDVLPSRSEALGLFRRI